MKKIILIVASTFALFACDRPPPPAFMYEVGDCVQFQNIKAVVVSRHRYTKPFRHKIYIKKYSVRYVYNGRVLDQTWNTHLEQQLSGCTR